MSGYWGQDTETGRVLDENGWLRTGDIGRLSEDGGLFLLSRIKDMIKSGGENVYASEVESVVGQHQGVHQVSVVGVPHARLGEMVSALICTKDRVRWIDQNKHKDHEVLTIGIHGNAELSLDTLSLNSLLDMCYKAGLSSYKIPKFWVIQSGVLPATSLGKVNKSSVRTRMIQLHQSRVQPLVCRL